jgi:hypothetical protein
LYFFEYYFLNFTQSVSYAGLRQFVTMCHDKFLKNFRVLTRLIDHKDIILDESNLNLKFELYQCTGNLSRKRNNTRLLLMVSNSGCAEGQCDLGSCYY